MITPLLILAIILLLALVVLQLVTLFRKPTIDLSPIQQANERASERTERAVREEIANNREEAFKAAQQLRQDMSTVLTNVGDTFNTHIAALTEPSSPNAKKFWEEAAANLQRLNESLVMIIGEMAKINNGQMGIFSERIDKLTQTNEQKLDWI